MKVSSVAVRNGSITSLNGKSDQRDLSAVVSALFPPRSHKTYLRQASLDVEPIYYDNVPVKERAPPLPPRKRNVLSYVEVFGPDSLLDPLTAVQPADFQSDRRKFTLAKQLSMDSAMGYGKSPTSRPATPELRRYGSDRNHSDDDFSRELRKWSH